MVGGDRRALPAGDAVEKDRAVQVEVFDRDALRLCTGRGALRQDRNADAAFHQLHQVAFRRDLVIAAAIDGLLLQHRADLVGDARNSCGAGSAGP